MVLTRPLIALSLLLGLAACDDSDTRATMADAVEQYGFEQVQITGRAWYGCSQDDAYGYRFTTRNALGRPVTGIVCSGLLKGATVRIGR